MSLIRSVAHNAAVQVVGKIISTLLGLAAVATMTRSLGLEQFGWYATALGFLQFVGVLSDFGFTITISNMLSEPRFEKQAILNTVCTWRVITAGLFQLLAPMIIWFFPYPAQVKLAVLIITFSFWAISVSNALVGWYRAELKMFTATAAELLGRLILVGGIALTAYTRSGFLSMMAVIALASLANAGYLYFKAGGFRLSLHAAISRDMFYKMWPTALAVIFNSFYLMGDRVILPLFVEQTSVGLYGAAYRVLDIVIQISAMMMGIVMPLITFAWSRGQTEEFKRRYQLGFDLMTLLLFPITAGAVVLAAPIMRFVAGNDFAPAGIILRWLAISIVGTCFGMIFGHIALAINRQKQTLWVYLSDAIFSIIGYFIFIPKYGVNGAIGVTIFSEWYAGLLLAVIAIYYSRIFPRIWTLLKILLASFLMGAAVYYLQPLNVLLSVALGAVIYALLILILRIVSPSTIREVLALKAAPAVATPTQV